MESGKDVGCQEGVSSDPFPMWQTQHDSVTSRLERKSGPQNPTSPVFNDAEWIVMLHLLGKGHF